MEPTGSDAALPVATDSLRVLLTVHHGLDPNAGAPGATHHLARAYTHAGHAAYVYSLDDLPSFLPQRAKSLLFPLFVAARLLRREGHLDVVDASTGDAWVWSLLRRRRRPLLVTRSHGLEHTAHAERLEEARRGHVRLSWRYPLYHGGLLLKAVETSIRRSDLALLLNAHDADYVVERFGVPRRRTRVVAHGLPEEFLARPFEVTPAPGEVLRVAQVGSYDARKGVHYSAPAVSRVLADHPEVELTLLGTGRPGDEVLAAFDPALHARIDVVASYARSDLPKLLHDHQIKVFATPSEGFGLALLEAMACGLAPVVTATPGPLSIVRPGHDALVVPPRDSDAIAAAVERLVSDRELLDRLRRNAYETAQANSWERTAEATLALYRELLGRNGKN